MRNINGCPKCGSNNRMSFRDPRNPDWVQTVCQCGHVHCRYRAVKK